MRNKGRFQAPGEVLSAKVELGHPRPHPFDIAGERICQHVLAGAIKFKAFGQLGEFHEGVPGELMNVRVLFAPPMGHNELHVVTHIEHLAVY
jgi:hypothetical protein